MPELSGRTSFCSRARIRRRVRPIRNKRTRRTSGRILIGRVVSGVSMGLMDRPIVLCISAAAVLWLSARAGIWLREKRPKFAEREREDLVVVLGAALTLLGLVIGFSFSMAV